jgi:hypothetical protein
VVPPLTHERVLIEVLGGEAPDGWVHAVLHLQKVDWTPTLAGQQQQQQQQQWYSHLLTH